MPVVCRRQSRIVISLSPALAEGRFWQRSLSGYEKLECTSRPDRRERASLPQRGSSRPIHIAAWSWNRAETENRVRQAWVRRQPVCRKRRSKRSFRGVQRASQHWVFARHRHIAASPDLVEPVAREEILPLQGTDRQWCLGCPLRFHFDAPSMPVPLFSGGSRHGRLASVSRD